MDVNFSLFNIGVPDYLILRARTTAAPGAEVGIRAVLGPAPAGTLNFLITQLPLENCFFDLYESADGATLNTLLGTFTYDVRNEKVVDEIRYYVVDSGVNNSPSNTDTTLTDSYLDGKTVTEFQKRSIGSLVPDGLGLNSEWSISGTSITLLGGLEFSTQETYAARISYLIEADDPTPVGFFKGIKTITTNTTLDNTYRNNRIKLVGAGTQLVTTMEHVSGIPDGTFWYFTDQNGGTQYQTKILLQDGNFLFNGVNYGETWIGKGESGWIEKNGSAFEFIQAPKGLLDVGTRSAETFNVFPNKLPENNGLYNADDYPRLWYWITHALPSASYYILDDNLDNIGYTRPVDVNGFPFKAGLFIISTTKRKFRMPDTQGYAERGMKSFTAFGADTTRLYDWPGGWQPQRLLTHVHGSHAGGTIDGPAGSLYMSRAGSGPQPHRFSGGGSDNLGGTTTPDVTMITSNPRTAGSATDISSSEQTVNNFGVIYMRNV